MESSSHGNRSKVIVTSHVTCDNDVESIYHMILEIDALSSVKTFAGESIYLLDHILNFIIISAFHVDNRFLAF